MLRRVVLGLSCPGMVILICLHCLQGLHSLHSLHALQRCKGCNNARHRGILQTAHRILSPMVIIGVFGFSIGDRKTENVNNPMVVYTVTDQDFMGLQ